MASRTILGAFLLGAYQEILGDMHNLFGDTNAVHVSLGDNGERGAGNRDQGGHRARGARLRRVGPQRCWSGNSATTSKWPCARTASTSSRPAA